MGSVRRVTHGAPSGSDLLIMYLRCFILVKTDWGRRGGGGRGMGASSAGGRESRSLMAVIMGGFGVGGGGGVE